MMKIWYFATSAALATAVSVFSSPGAATPARERFVGESIGQFGAAYQRIGGYPLDRAYRDPAKYHAYRYVTKSGIVAVVARSVTRNRQGDLQFSALPGAVGTVKKTVVPGVGHVLLPISARPPS